MNYKERSIELKNGKLGIFRAPVVADAPELLRYLVDTATQTPYLLRMPQECNMSLEAEEAYLRNAAEEENELMILCFVDGRLAGNCALQRKTKLKNRHRASIGIALRKEFWNLGIGTVMFRELIRIAREQGIEQLELEVFEGNTRAMALYEKMGFRIVAATPNAIHLPDGRVLKEFLMIREVEKA